MVSRTNWVHGVAIAIAMAGTAESTAAAQPIGKATVRVANANVSIVSRRAAGEVVAVVPAEAELEVLQEEQGWLWIVLPPDVRGTRRAGWLRASDVAADANEPPAPSARSAADTHATDLAAEEPKDEKPTQTADIQPERQPEKQPDSPSLDKARERLAKARAHYEAVTKSSTTSPDDH